jgi:hypothetical protein
MFNPDEQEHFKAFCQTCDRISACRFVIDFPKQSHHIFVGTLPDGRVVDEYPRYDDDDFRAFLTHYRKLRLQRECTNLYRIMNLLQKGGHQRDRVLLKGFKKEIEMEGRNWWGAMVHDANGKKTLVRQDKLEDLILNGEVFHSDSDKKDELTQVIANTRLTKAVALLSYMRFAMTVVRCARKTAELIRRRGYVD